MARLLLVTAAVATGLLAGRPAAADVLGELQACRTLADAERLACFDRVLAGHDAAKLPPAAEPGPAAAAPPKPAADFGGERLRQADDAAAEPEYILATVTSFSFNAIKHFTVTLDNGQVWRQLESDTAAPRLKGRETVRIVRGFLDSYSLSIEGVWGTYKVKRIK